MIYIKAIYNNLSIPSRSNYTYKESVGIVRIICFRGSGKPLLQDKTTPHAKPVYITELYIWQA